MSDRLRVLAITATPMVGHVIEITASNVDSWRKALGALREGVGALHRMLARGYPVIIETTGCRFVVSSKDEIAALTRALDDKLRAWDATDRPSRAPS